MTHLQKIIRARVAEFGSITIGVNNGYPATLGTLRALQRAGYSVKHLKQNEYSISK